MAKLKIGEAVSEVKDIKIDDVEAQGVSGVIDNSRNWTSITIGDTTGTIPAGSSGLEDRVTALEEKLDGVTRIGEAGIFVDENTYFGENVAVDGDLTVNGLVINLNGAVIGVEDVDGVMRVGQYVTETIGDSWTYVGGAYTEDKVLATGITEDAVGENGWTEDDTLPVSPNEGEIKYSSMLGAVVLMLDSKKYYTQVNTKLLILESGSYTVVESDYPGYEELTEETFKPFAFEEE